MHKPTFTKEEALEKLNRIKKMANQLENPNNTQFGIFTHKSLEILNDLFGGESWRYRQFNSIEWSYNPGFYVTGMDIEGPSKQIFSEAISSVNAIVDDAIADINSGELVFSKSIDKPQDSSEITKENPRTLSNGKVFITHGSSGDWRQVQRFVESRLRIETIELAEYLSKGRTIIEKLEDASNACFYAIIVMTGDDIGNKGDKISEEEAILRVRENVMHEIGFFQGKYGRQNVILLHENGVSIPSNLQGVVYEGYPKGYISATFERLRAEIEAAMS